MWNGRVRSVPGPFGVMSDLEAQLAKRDKEIEHLRGVNEKQTRSAFNAEAEFERKLDAAELAVREAKAATREAKDKACEDGEQLRRKIKAAKKKTEKEREAVDKKDAELVRFTERLQGVMNLLDASRAETEAAKAHSRESDDVTRRADKLDAEIAKAHSQIDELTKTLERERALGLVKHAELVSEKETIRKYADKIESIAKQQKEEADMTLESMRAALTMQMEAAETAQALAIQERDANKSGSSSSENEESKQKLLNAERAAAEATSAAAEATAHASTLSKEVTTLTAKVTALTETLAAARAAEAKPANAEKNAEWNAKKLKKAIEKGKGEHLLKETAVTEKALVELELETATKTAGAMKTNADEAAVLAATKTADAERRATACSAIEARDVAMKAAEAALRDSTAAVVAAELRTSRAEGTSACSAADAERRLVAAACDAEEKNEWNLKKLRKCIEKGKNIEREKLDLESKIISLDAEVARLRVLVNDNDAAEKRAADAERRACEAEACVSDAANAVRAETTRAASNVAAAETKTKAIATRLAAALTRVVSLSSELETHNAAAKTAREERAASSSAAAARRGRGGGSA